MPRRVECQTSADVGSCLTSSTQHNAELAATDDSDDVVDVVRMDELNAPFFGRRRRLGAWDRDDLVINILTRGRDFPSAAYTNTF